MFLQALWLVVHLGCVGSFVLSSQQSSNTISLYEFTKALATQLSNKHFCSSLLLPPLVCNDLPINADNVDKNVIGFSEECKALENSCSFERDVSSTKQRRSPYPRLTGLINLGNSCYMNAVLQCLSGTASLVEYLLSRVNQVDLARCRCDAVCAFITLLTEMWTGEYEHISPVEIRTVIGSLHPQFASNTQQDAQELLLYLFNRLHEVLKKTTVRKQPRGSLKRQEAGKSFDHSSETSIITHLFEGQLCYVTLCLQCDNQTRTDEVFTILSLPIPPGACRCSLLDCLELFFQQNTLTRNNQILCSSCRIKRDTAVLTSISKAPEILILHLKRFEVEGLKKRKLRTDVSFSLENLDLSPYLSSSPSSHSRYYLYAVVVSNL
ncbi:putative ubiquitin carboxyl-terminal hydrolase 50 isoform X2 [Polyodon spathula]|uniref:putative ubiquitin carboxyl-terminal hydrolase 50 isoform X2 n=1 Tax=Polyodon spathula TaxID=7913 RepID=UPI001B7DA221|nr:putative ubiquitin carboxyl-terminal hydrolase 50 isoform X2 [Polyodon spathula]